MERLEQIKIVANNLRIDSTKAVRALHRIIFEQEGDRCNRKRLHKFKGFAFATRSDEYKSKLAFVEANIGWGDLVSACNILAIDYAGTKRELGQRLCGYLVDLNALNNASETDKEEDDHDASSEDEEDVRQQRRIEGITH